MKKIDLAKICDKYIFDYFTDCPENRHSLPTKFGLNLMYKYGVIRRNEIDKIKKWKNAYRGRRCFIIGNGPSLNLVDLSYLKNELTFGVNAIYLKTFEYDFVPTFHVVEDYLVAADRVEEIRSLAGTTKFVGNHLNDIFFDNTFTKLNTSFNYGEYSGFPDFSKNAARKVFVGGTVTYICMQLAFYMGFSEVFIIGFDHSYKVPDDHQVSGTVIKSVGGDPNHFNDSYFGYGKRWHLPMVERMEVAYEKANKVFQSDGRVIKNATVGGNLEVFDRVEYSSLFK